jgi:hypothetical protein
MDINSAWELLQRISKSQPKRLQVIMNWKSIKHGLTEDAQQY